MSIRLLIADDQTLIREGLETILSTQPGIDVVATAGDGEEAVRLARELQPDVVLMDIRMPRVDGLEATRRLLAGAPPSAPRVLMLTTFDEDALVLDAMRAGASGFLLKDMPQRRLVEAIRAAHDGELQLSPSITHRLVERQLSAGPSPQRQATLARLTARETDVLKLVAGGANNDEIARGLHLSESTVKTHIGQLLQKLSARDRVHLVIFAYDVGLAP